MTMTTFSTSCENISFRNRFSMKFIGLLLLFVMLSVSEGWGQIAQFDFPATNSLVVSAKNSNVTVSNLALSAGTVETNKTAGSYFPNEPYIEETDGWSAATQATSKNFYFTITANSGYQFTITNISFRAYATSAGPTAYGFAIGSSDLYTTNALDASLVTVNQSVSGQTGLTSATIKIQGWLNGSRESAGSGAFRLDDVVISGTVTAVSSFAPTKLAITSVPTTVYAGTAFNVTVQSQDGSSQLAAVTSQTGVSLTNTGGGTIAGNTANIANAATSVTLNSVTLDTPATGVTLTASTTSGMSLTASAASSPFTVYSAMPSVASAVNTSARTATGTTVSWTNGGGDGRIVVARSTSTTAIPPTLGTTYTPSASGSFTGTTLTGTGNVVVYNGTASSIAVSNLSNATAYTYDVYEYNGSGSTISYSAAASSSSTSTLAAAPTASASNVQITANTISSNGMTATWSNGTGGSGRIVVARLTSTTAIAPTNGTAYTPSASGSFTGTTTTGTGNIVIYSGSLSTIAVTNLTANNAYTYDVYEYNGSSTTINYASAASTSMTTLGIAASSATVASKTSTTMNLTWTNGTGSGVIVVGRASSNTLVAPTNGTSYTCNSTDITDALNSSTGAGNVIVYKGTGTSVSVTGLSPAIQYTFYVYTYNSSNYYSTAASTAATYTLATEPTIQASNVSFSNIASTSMTINFTKGDAAYDGRIVLIKSGSAVNSDPIDATPYTVANGAYTTGTQIGTGNYVVYSGTGTSVTVTGLTANTTYSVAVYEFNGSGSTSNFLITSPATGSQLTSPAAPTSPTFSSVTTSSFLASFVAPAITPTGGYLVLRRAGSVVTSTPSNGTEYSQGQTLGSDNIEYVGASVWTNYNQTALTSNTTYYYAVYAYNGSSTTTTYSPVLTASQTTSKVEPTNQVTNLVQGTLTTTTIPLTWTAAATGTQAPDGYIIKLSTGSITDPVNGTDPGAGSLAISSGAATYKITSAATTSATFTGATAGTAYNIKVYSYTNSATQINFNTTTTPYISVTTLPSPVTSGTFVATGATAATISWTAASGYSSANQSTLVFVKATSAITAGTPTNAPSAYTANTVFGSGTAYQGDNSTYCIYNGDGTSASVSGLTANTTYQVLIYTVVDNSNTNSTNSYSSGATTSGTTTTIPVTLPYSQGFEGTISEWALASSGTNLWAIGSATNNGGSKALYISNDGGVTNAYTTSNASIQTTDATIAVDLTGISGATLSFDWKANGEASYDYGEVYVNNGAGDVLISASKEFQGTTTFANKKISLTSYVGGIITLKFRWRFDTSAGANPPFAIDNVSITKNVDAPIASEALSISSSGFTANWSASDGASSYKLDVSSSPTFTGSGSVSVSEGFESGVPVSYAVSNTYTLGSGTWTFVNVMASTTVHGGSVSAQLKASAGIATTPALNAVASISFWAKGSNSNSLTIQKIVNGGSASTIATQTLTSAFAQYTINVHETNSNIQIVFNNGSGNVIYLDDVTINYTGSVPSLLSGYNDLQVSGTSQEVIGLSANTSYYYRVRAVGPNNTSTNSETITVITSKLTPTIGFTTPTSLSKNFGDAAFVNGATANSGGTISYSSDNTDVATVNSSTGQVTIVSVGSANITATVTANGNYNSGSVSYALTVSAVIPTITTTSVGSITSTSALSGVGVTNNGGTAVSESGICWNTSGNPTTVNSHTTSGSGALTGLSPATTYYVKAFATNTAGTAYGSEVSFTTLESYNITASSNDEAKGSVSGGGTKDAGASVSLTATPANGSYRFVNWTENGSFVSKANPLEFTASAARNLVANFDDYSPAVSGEVNASTLADCPTCDLTVSAGAILTINESKTFNSVTVAPGAKLTLNNGSSFAPGTFVLESNASATATFVDKRTHATKTNITATVQQHLPASTDRLWWYLASPVSDDVSTVFGSNKVGEYNETTRSYSNPFAGSTALVAGKGYVVKMTNESAANYVFTNKTLNTGDISVTLTRTVTQTPDNAKRGFNLVGNPYPSYLNWNMAYNLSTNIRPTIWYRTLVYDEGSTSYKMDFHTYNASLNVAVPSSVSGYIPPMQAFWVKVNADPVSPATVSNGTLNMTNDMRSHDESEDGNPLKAPAVERPLVRLVISNGSASDEAVIVAHTAALDGYDSFDSEKMANDNINKPEIYSIAGTQELVISGVSPLSVDKQLALGVRPGKSGDYSISVGELKGIPADLKVVLKDKHTGAFTELTAGTAYSFNTDGNTVNDRFSLLFRAKDISTDIDNGKYLDLQVYGQNGQIVLRSAKLTGAEILVFNALGQPLYAQQSEGTTCTVRGNFTPGVYLVKVNNEVRKVTLK